MAEQLSTPRILFDAQTQSAQLVCKYDPLIADMGHKIVQPLGFKLTVKDSGMFIFKDGVRTVEANVLYDEYGRPLTEDVLNEDRNEITARQWYYETGEIGFDSTFENGSEVIADQSFWQIDETTFAYSKNGNVFYLRKEENGDNTEWVVCSDGGVEFERTAYGPDGKILWVRSENAVTSFHYDQQGRLIREEKNPGSIYIDNQPSMDITEYSYEGDDRVRALGLTGVGKGTHSRGIAKLEQLTHYDQKRRPVKIDSKEGIFDMGQVLIRIAVDYPS